jgi:hypothetical protein
MANFTQDLIKNLFDYDSTEGGLIWKVNTGKRKLIGKRYGFFDGMYRKGMLLKTSEREHRLIWLWHFGEITEGMDIDHSDGDTMNNKIENLRLATRAQNLANQKKTKNKKSSIYKGVYKKIKDGKEYIYAQYNRQYLGIFQTEEEAAIAYDTYTIQTNKEFAKTNF